MHDEIFHFEIFKNFMKILHHYPRLALYTDETFDLIYGFYS